MLKVSQSIIQDAINISNGVYAPLIGFLGKKDFENVLDNMRLESGEIWSIPIVLDISEEEARELEGKNELEITDEEGQVQIKLRNIEIYKYDKNEFAKKVYSTLDKTHPGVEEVMNMKDYLVGGEIASVKNYNKIFPEYYYTPEETRKIFKEKGWDRVVAFQTRNVPHRGHEFLQKYALSQVDGLFIQPVIGKKKLEDFKDEYILASYEILIERYYQKDKTFLGILPLRMRYGGPREALMHALIRKNYGCTHFIVGRDHAGVGNFYAPLAAQKIFDKFSKDELGIEIMKLEEVVYCKSKNEHCFISDCAEDDKMPFSGTKLRDYMRDKQQPPEYLIRPEVYFVLANTKSSLVDHMYKKNQHQKGFVLWFTGLSASGKSTIANRVYEELKNRGMSLERLDGDVVRETLTQDLGFSREDRDENIRRVGFVAKLMSRNGTGVIASFISPYKREREELKKNIENFIEIFIDTPLEICEKRDPKGLYKKARAGEIKMFTGISDPYEAPVDPDIYINEDDGEVEEKAQKVIKYLEEKNLIK